MSSTSYVSKPTIYLLGDAILDNYYMLSNKEQDLRKEIIDLGFNVENYSADDIKVGDVINGMIPRDLYIKSRGYPYPIESNGKIYPLRLVTSGIGINRSFTPIYGGIGIRSINNKTNDDNMVVISMGGNDIYSKSTNIMFGVEYFMGTVITEDFISNYRKVIDVVRGSCDKIILVSIYLPYMGVGSSYAIFNSISTNVIEKWNNFIRNIAKQYNIPILDLSKTLNVKERSHYGTDDTRVSNISNKCMAECIAHIYSHYDGYHIYYAPNCDTTHIIKE